MALTIIRHKVRDYATWRKVYDDVGPMQKAGGVTEESVYQSKDDPNDVTVLHKFATMEEAERFVGSPDLKSAMQRAGVEGAPQIQIVEEARRLARA